MYKFIVQEDQSGTRLDMFAAAHMPNISRAFIQKLCQDEKILVNESPAKSGHRLRTGDRVTIDYDETSLTVPKIDLPIMYEDNDCLVINKPPGILTHAQSKHGNEPTVATFLRDHTAGNKALDQSRLPERAGIVHRLDRATSGVLICAKNQTALSFLQSQFSQRKVKKTYIAVTEGTPSQKEALIDMPIERNPKAPATFRARAGGKPATTHYHVLESNSKFALIELKPVTGRTHQLRVHLAEIGHPIIGDPLYGHGHFGDRLYLHAQSLEITLPSKEHRTFTAVLPLEFKQKVVA